MSINPTPETEGSFLNFEEDEIIESDDICFFISDESQKIFDEKYTDRCEFQE